MALSALAQPYRSLPALTVVNVPTVFSLHTFLLDVGQTVDLSKDRVFIVGTRQPVQVMKLTKNGALPSTGYTALCYIPSGGNYRTLHLVNWKLCRRGA